MIDMKIEHSFGELVKDLDLLQHNLHDKAMVMAINRTIRGANTEMKRAITSRYRLLQKDLKAKFHVRGANKNALSGVLSVSGKRTFNMIRFVKGARPKTGYPQTTKGGRRKKVKQLGIQVLKQGRVKSIRGAFIGNKGRTVFIRSNLADNNSKIEAVQTVGVRQMFNTRVVQKRVYKRMHEQFPKEWERASALVLRRFHAKK